jgi:hypothetical protein
MSEKQWESVKDAAEEVSVAYEQLLRASDALAEAMNFNPEYVLLHVLPRNCQARRNVERIKAWVESRRAHVETFWKEREAEQKKAALLARLKLTAEEKSLLGLASEKEGEQ